MTEKLKPCPFCGGEAKLCNTARQDMFRVVCTQCLSEGYIHQGISRAVHAWNRRVPHD